MYPAISTTGRYAAFCSMASNLVAGDTNGFMDVFVRDRDTDETRRVSVTQAGSQTDEKSTACAISTDGRWVVFQSEASNIINGSEFGWPGIYLADTTAPTPSIRAVSISQTDGPPNERSIRLSMSPDARYVAFRSLASNLVSDDTNGFDDVFLRDTVAEVTTRVSVADETDAEGNGNATGSTAVTPDGRYVVFASAATNLVDGDTNGKGDVFIRDLTLGTTERVSVSSTEQQGNDDSGGDTWMLAVSSDGRYVAFASLASNLVPGDTNESWDVFVRDRTAGTTSRASVSSDGVEGNGDSGLYSIDLSADGQTTVFDSYANNLVPLDYNGGPDVFAHGEPLSLAAPILVIEEDAQYTTVPEVTLQIDPGSYSELRFKNEEEAWTAWEPAVETKEWTLTSGDGVKRVSIQGRVDSEESVENYDEIILDTAAPAGAGVTINGGDTTTISRVVTLTLTAEEATQMRFRNETSSWSAWEPFATSKEWKLSSARMTKTVGFEVRDSAGNTSPEVTDTIELITFTDVPEDFWAFDEIMACVDAAVVAGYLDGSYQPGTAVTRDQMAVYVSRSLAGGDDNVPAGPEEPTFIDVGTEQWAYDYIEYAAEMDVVQGFPGGDYLPELEVNRGTMAVYIARAIADPVGESGLVSYVPPETPTFPDVSNTGYGDDGTEPYWAYKYIEYVAEAGVVQGYPYDDVEHPGEIIYMYQPEDVVTRDQMAVYVARAFGLM